MVVRSGQPFARARTVAPSFSHSSRSQSASAFAPETGGPNLACGDEHAQRSTHPHHRRHLGRGENKYSVVATVVQRGWSTVLLSRASYSVLYQGWYQGWYQFVGLIPTLVLYYLSRSLTLRCTQNATCMLPTLVLSRLVAYHCALVSSIGGSRGPCSLSPSLDPSAVGTVTTVYVPTLVPWSLRAR